MSDTTEVQTDSTEDTTVDTNTDTNTLLTDTNSDTADDNAAADDNSDGDKAAADDTGEGSQTVPDTYADFAMPEGVEVDSALMTEATLLFKELNLSQADAQKLVDFQASQAKASSEKQADTFNQLMNDWQESSKNDKEFGGDKFEENVKIAQSAVDKFGTPELKQLLEEHGVGNHPEVIRFMIKVGKLTAEDVPGATTTPQSKAQDRISLLYPTDKTA